MMRARLIWTSALGVAVALAAVPACAGGLIVQVTAGGRPVTDAVVTLHAIGRPTPQAPAGGHYAVSQKDIAFHPFVSVVPLGAEVSFPNLDAIRHHVYSFSPAKRFELKLYGRDDARTVRFDKPGVVALGCNIHDSMSAYVIVTDSAWAQATAAPGTVQFRGLAPGRYTLDVWHPFLRAAGNVVSRIIEIDDGDRRETVAVALRMAPMHDMSGY